MSTTDSPAMNIGVKKVPYHVWQRARHNAIASGLAFRDYLIAILATCTPVNGNAAALHPDQEPCQANTDVPSTSSTEGGHS